MKELTAHFVATSLLLVTAINAHGYEYVLNHGMSPSKYQNTFTKLSKQGFRLTNVSGYIEGKNERYAALWEKHAKGKGAPYIAKHGMTPAVYQKQFNKWTKKGFRLIHVDGFSVIGGVKFAAIWEKSLGPQYFTRHNMTAAQYQNEFDAQLKLGFRLSHVSGYSLNRKPRFAAIWEKKQYPPRQIQHGMSSQIYQAQHDKWRAAGYRLTHVTGYEDSGAARYAAIWTKTSGPRQWNGHGLHKKNFQSAFENAYYSGYVPANFSAFSVSEKARFNVTYQGGGLNNTDQAALNNLVNSFMTNWQIPGLGIAISNNERLVYARGYGFSDVETNTYASPYQLFRIASVSKPVTSITAMKLVEMGLLNLDQRVFGPGGVLAQDYGQLNYPLLLQVRVRHLLEHTAGWANPNLITNVPANQPQLNQQQFLSWALQNNNLPFTALPAPSGNFTVTNTPGANRQYSNYGYFVLGRVIEKAVAGQNIAGLGSSPRYDDIVKALVLEPAGVTGMQIGGMTLAQRRPNEARYYGQGGGNPYSILFPRLDSVGGWIASPVDFARLLVRVDGRPNKKDILSRRSLSSMVTPAGAANNNPITGIGVGSRAWRIGRGPVGTTTNWPSCNNSPAINSCDWHHNGSLHGTGAQTILTPSGFTLTIFTNSRPPTPTAAFFNQTRALLLNISTTVSNWPTYDLF